MNNRREKSLLAISTLFSGGYISKLLQASHPPLGRIRKKKAYKLLSWLVESPKGVTKRLGLFTIHQRSPECNPQRAGICRMWLFLFFQLLTYLGVGLEKLHKHLVPKYGESKNKNYKMKDSTLKYRYFNIFN